MSIRVQCDRCMKETIFYGTEEEAVERGWKVQEFGHTCYPCTQALKDADELGESSSTLAAIEEGLKKV